MINIVLYRIRIGSYNCIRNVKFSRSSDKISGILREILMTLFIIMLTTVLILCFSKRTIVNQQMSYKLAIDQLPFMVSCCQAQSQQVSISHYSECSSETNLTGLVIAQVHRYINQEFESNFYMRCLHGNVQRGIKNVHINVRSLYNKINEVKTFIKDEKPHILGVSEAELLESHHSLDSLKVPGYQLLLPKSWESQGKARLVVFIKKCLQYEQVDNLENCDVQSIWVRANFKNCRKIYFSHVYREHTNTLGNSMAAQKYVLDKMLRQWEDAVHFENSHSVNEVHISGDMNLDTLNGKWLDNNYSLVSLSRMVRDCCNTNNLSQLVQDVTRVQFDSTKRTTQMSCIDHVYSNSRHRISPVKIISWGSSDHDAISYVRYSKEPRSPAKTIRKRSYKNFNEQEYLKDIASLDFLDVYCCLDVDEAAEVLTQKIVSVLNVHAPWVIFQQRRNFAPWVTENTLKLMKQRDKFKKEAKVMAMNEGSSVSSSQCKLWQDYKKTRNKINNILKTEEIRFKKEKFKECQHSSSQTWDLAKRYMDWASAGPPSMLEEEVSGSLCLITKASEIAKIMNEYFVAKIQNIVSGLKDTGQEISGCEKIMEGKNLSLSFNYVSVNKVKKLLKSLKNKKSTAVDMLDSYSVKIAADYIVQPLHHVISLMQEKFPSCWKSTKIIPLHKKGSTLKKEHYRPVAILSPLSKVLEKVVYEQLYSYFSKNKLFSESLHGYRANRSTLTALLTMYEKWVTAASQNQVTGVVLADLSAAFDLVSPDLLIKKLRVYGLDEGSLGWIYSYLTRRQQSVWIDHVFSENIETNIGVPQGSNLGPLLFLVFFNDLPISMNGEIDCYADDSTISTTDKNIQKIEEKLDSNCELLSDWMARNKFKLNAAKTHFMVVGTSAKLLRVQNINVKMDDVALQQNSEKKESLLGIMIQSNLKWSSQVESLCSRLKSRLAGLERLRWLTSSDTRKKLVDGLFHSVLCYCLPLFGGCSQSELDSIQVLQNRAARFVLNYPPRSNRAQMFNKLGWLTVRQIAAYHSLVLVHQIRVSKEPLYLAAKLNRVNCNNNIVLKNTPLDLYRNSFVYRSSLLWNKLPHSMREDENKKSFKNNIKNWIRENFERF